MKLKEFISDSMSIGKGSVKYPIGMFVKKHRDDYNKFKSKGANFTHQVYSVSPGDRRMVHVKVPSETVKDFYYDVVFEMTPDSNSVNIADCDVKVFSNCPSFVYTSAYVFAHWDPDLGKVSNKGKGMMIDAFKRKLPRDRMLIPGLESKLGDQPIHDKPETRNPLGAPLFDKSLYYATFYVMENVPLTAITDKIPTTTSIKVYNSIADFDQLMTARSLAVEKQKNDRIAAQKKLVNAFKGKERAVNNANRGVRGLSKPKAMSRTISTSKTSGLKSPKRIGK